MLEWERERQSVCVWGGRDVNNNNMLLHFWTTSSGIVCFILFWSNFGVSDKTLSEVYGITTKHKQAAGDRYLFPNEWLSKVSLRRGIAGLTTVYWTNSLCFAAPV